jgi:polyribonucleotide nucleotidyltransferase
MMSAMEEEIIRTFQELNPIYSFENQDVKELLTVDKFEKNPIEEDKNADAPVVTGLDEEDDNTVISAQEDKLMEEEKMEDSPELQKLYERKSSAAQSFNYSTGDIKLAIKKLLKSKLYELVKITGHRADGRTPEEVRQIEIETSLLPCAHGSALFTR